ncbi:hypothetical protein BLA29_014587, partial [Euroglyphus maynei]
MDLTAFEPGKLQALKDRLIEIYKPSKLNRREKLRNRKGLEGLKPSQAWNWAVTTAGDIYTKSELLAHWIDWIPKTVAITIEQQTLAFIKDLEESPDSSVVLRGLQ